MSFLLEIFCCCLVDNQKTTTIITDTFTDVNNTVPVGLTASDNKSDLELNSLRTNNVDTNNSNNSNNGPNIVSQTNDIVQHVSVISMLS